MQCWQLPWHCMCRCLPLAAAAMPAQQSLCPYPTLRCRLPRLSLIPQVGIALMATLLHRSHGRVERVERLTIQPRGDSPARVLFARGVDEDYMFMTRGRWVKWHWLVVGLVFCLS